MIGYFGAILAKEKAGCSTDQQAKETWVAQSKDYYFSVEGANSCTATLECDGKKLVSLGIVRRCGQPFHRDQKIVLEEILADYEKSGELKIKGLEGSFTVLLADPVKEKFFLFRNVVGSTFAYYTQTPQGLFFGNNLAEVARKSHQTLRVNESQLPIFFIYRVVPDSYTLFENVFRIHPGELLLWEQGRLQVRRVQTVADFLESHKTNEKESIDRTEAIMGEVLRDWNEFAPQTAVLLSGGVDSTYLQVHWNRIKQEASEKPKSVAVTLDHPHTQGDFDYAMSAVKECRTEHQNVRQSLLSREMIREIFAQTGEMPNHVQSFYFWTLAAEMKKVGLDAGISGEGADGLFGSGGPDNLQAARLLQKKYPSRLLRSTMAGFGHLLKPNNYRSKLLVLSNHIDDLSWEEHPLNQAAAFSDFPTVHRLFSKEVIHDVFAFRQAKIKDYGVPYDPDYLLWTNLSGYFFEGINTAAYWGQMFLSNRVFLYSPFQDSRIIRVASNIDLPAHFVPGNPKQILKKALLNHVSPEFANRPKLAFGQPIFEWLSPGGCLREAAENIADYPFMPNNVKQDLLDKPNWILWTLLCFDLWYKEFIE